MERVVVACVEEDEGEYGLFFHEADLVLHSVASGYLDGTVTVEDAQLTMLPYRDLYPELFDGSLHDDRNEPESDDDDDRQTWSGFANGVIENEGTTATFAFIDLAQSLGGLGANHTLGGPASGPILSVRGNDALERLRNELSAQYKIVVLTNEQWKRWQQSPADAHALIRELREQSDAG